MTAPDVMPLQVRLAAAVCACGCLAQEHNYSATTGRRTGCSHVSGPGVCACLAYDHAVDRYAVSTYVDVPAGEAPPQVALQRLDELPATRAARSGMFSRDCGCGAVTIPALSNVVMADDQLHIDALNACGKQVRL